MDDIGVRATVPSTLAVLDISSETPARARRIADRFMRGLMPPPGRETAAAVELVISELITNAVRHAGGTSCSITLSVRPEGIEVAVTDDSPVPPRERVPDFSGAKGGFGWRMVCRLASSVSVDADAGGKTIRVLMAR
ncbi:ATP-binding protein [Streptomyces sp. NPDC051776]|uniref:ATP-binding protein n=1 Tax=Streptomyces sp. NPDC051776 TaxID=3155414 RepID=UPI0034481AAA